MREFPLLNDIKTKIALAVMKLMEKDEYLLQNDVNERSITHRLAMYIQEQFPEWDVDCEYNKIDFGENGITTKRIADNDDVEYIKINDTNGKTVYPDIIIHHRGHWNENLLVIEVKKSTNNEDINNDLKKLEKLKHQLKYQHTLFLKFNTGEKDISVNEPLWDFIRS